MGRKEKDLGKMEKRQYPTQDWFTKPAAEQLARNIRDYWAARGYDVETNIHVIKNDRGDWHTVRSDMVSGMPVRRSVVLAA